MIFSEADVAPQTGTRAIVTDAIAGIEEVARKLWTLSEEPTHVNFADGARAEA